MGSLDLSFEYLEKHDFSIWSNKIFCILADNMEIIAPTGNTREDDYKCWYEGVSNGLKRDERQIVLIKDAEVLSVSFSIILMQTHL